MPKHEREREALHAAVDKWFDAMVKNPPRLDEGEFSKLEVTAWQNGYRDDDDAIISFTVTTTNAEPV